MDPLNQPHVRIEPLGRSNFEAALPLIAAYQRFYEATPDEARNRAYFERFLDDHERGVLFIAFEHDGTPVGFATLYFIPSSLSAAIVCTFNDLYTVPEVRGKGIGVVIGLHCLVYARDRGFKRVSWLTHPSNKVAQQIYDYTHAKRSEWYEYDINLEFS